MCGWCNCDGLAAKDRLFIEATRDAASKFASAPGALSMIRNAGWEQTFRNQLLVALERQDDEVTGFTEGSTGGVKRVDLLLACNSHAAGRKEHKRILGVEIKINYYRQPVKEIATRMKCGKGQLTALGDVDPKYLVYVIAYPWGVEDGDNTVKVHNDQYRKSTDYKRFAPPVQRITCFSKFNHLLPSEDRVCTEEVRVGGSERCADMAVWVWRVEGQGEDAKLVRVVPHDQ